VTLKLIHIGAGVCSTRHGPAPAKLIEVYNHFGEPQSDIPHFPDYALTGHAADMSKPMRMDPKRTFERLDVFLKGSTLA
jgi:hypothetical protein